jgi:uncharacterized protein YbjT (DUF2867 family)
VGAAGAHDETSRLRLISAPIASRDANFVFFADPDRSRIERPFSRARGNDVKFVVIGGTGLIGAKTVDRLRKKGHEVVAASPRSGVDTVTGEGLAAAVAGAQVVVDLANSPSFEAAAALEFFQKSGRNLIAAEKAAGVRHHVALSVVGTDRLLESGYFRAKLAQENLIERSGIPYSIVRSTQFFEFLGAIVQSGTVDQAVHMPPALMQPIASDDVADVMTDVALGPPVNGTIEIAGPERMRLDELVGRFLRATGDPRKLVTDPRAPYYGIAVDDRSLVPGADPRVGATRFEEWLARRAR